MPGAQAEIPAQDRDGKLGGRDVKLGARDSKLGTRDSKLGDMDGNICVVIFLRLAAHLAIPVLSRDLLCPTK